VGELRGLFRREVVAVEVEGAVAVGAEVHGVADPHRVAVGARVVGHLLELVALEVEEVEVLGPAALIALPGAEVAGVGRVDDAAAVGREVAGARRRHRQRHRQTAVDGDEVEARVGDVDAVAQGAEEHLAAVRRPADDLVVVAPAGRQGPARRVIGELTGGAAAGGDHVDLLVAVVLAGEGDALAVGGELGKELETGMGGQPPGGAAAGRGQPQVAGVAEDHPVAVEVGEAQQAGGLGFGGESRRDERAEDGKAEDGDRGQLTGHGFLRGWAAGGRFNDGDRSIRCTAPEVL
jgi:hypothetical protein